MKAAKLKLRRTDAGYSCTDTAGTKHRIIATGVASSRLRLKYIGSSDPCLRAPSILGTKPIEAAAPPVRLAAGLEFNCDGGTLLF